MKANCMSYEHTNTILDIVRGGNPESERKDQRHNKKQENQTLLQIRNP